MRRINGLPPLFRLLGVLALLAGLYLMGGSVVLCVEQCQQTDWRMTSASVTDCSSRVIRSGGRGHSHSRTFYDVTYQYQVNGKCYTGQGTGQAAPHLVGDSLSIKYDPECPDSSTTVLMPRASDWGIPFGAGVLFCVLGGFLSGLLGRRRNRSASDTTREEVGVSEKPILTAQSQNGSRFRWMRYALLPLVLMGGVFLVLTLEPKEHPAERFRTAMEQKQYPVSDTTEQLRQEWKLGSLLVEACSVEVEGLHIDCCVMDSADSAQRLYAGMTLPLSDGVEQSGTHWMSKENETVYVTKRYVDHMVVYGAAELAQKVELQALLTSAE